jgi:predicted dehydrogenase
MTAAGGYLVIGTGSIARRHMTNLKALFGDRVGCVAASGRTVAAGETPADVVYADLQQALDDQHVFAVVASPAPLHVRHAAQLLRAGVPVLIEKPLCTSMEQFQQDGAVLWEHRDELDVGYNLRLLSSAQRFKQLIDEERIGRVYRVVVEVGQYLPDWRPNTDYRQNVSARRALGGGVLLELSHELDYLRWVFGEFDSVYCVARNSGALAIDVEDQVDAILQGSGRLLASLHMDFLQRRVTRTCKVVGEQGNLVWDLAANSIRLYSAAGVEVLFEDSGHDRNEMYCAELARFAQVAAGELPPLVGLADAVRTLQLIDALRSAAEIGQVVHLGATAT